MDRGDVERACMKRLGHSLSAGDPHAAYPIAASKNIQAPQQPPATEHHHLEEKGRLERCGEAVLFSDKSLEDPAS